SCAPREAGNLARGRARSTTRTCNRRRAPARRPEEDEEEEEEEGRRRRRRRTGLDPHRAEPTERGRRSRLVWRGLSAPVRGRVLRSTSSCRRAQSWRDREQPAPARAGELAA
ncbi:unnamed protein product, partial [Prorocentrum cordatum]